MRISPARPPTKFTPNCVLDLRNVSFDASCLGDTSAIKVGSPIPDMGPCKGLARAYAAYRGVLGPVDAALASAVQAKADADQRIEAIMRKAADVH